MWKVFLKERPSSRSTHAVAQNGENQLSIAEEKLTTARTGVLIGQNNTLLLGTLAKVELSSTK